MDSLIVINSDVCADFPLSDLLIAHSQQSEEPRITLLSIKARREEAMNYGNIVVAPGETRVKHYQEKPESVESYGDYAEISGGIYVLSPGIFGVMDGVFAEKGDVFSLESNIFPLLTRKGQMFVHRSPNFWSQIKTAGSAIYANRHYLSTYKRAGSSHSGMLQEESASIVGDVHVDRSAQVHPTAKLGPNVTVSAGVRIGAGARIRDAILLEGVIVGEHAVVMNAIVDQRSTIGSWARVEGATVGVNPNDPTTHEPTTPLFSNDGRLNAQVTILGEETRVQEGSLVRHVICMPHKALTAPKYSNEIIL
jgi:mannose-1-phosphate guanylyltransferase